MIDPSHIPPVDQGELLARFILQRGEVRSDGSAKPQLFLPYQRVELSVNRHRDATEQETWEVGRDVAQQRGKTLLGRADIRAVSCSIAPLHVVPRPILPANPNHADVTGYPPRKDDQMSLAAKLAASIEGKWISPPVIDESAKK